MHILYHYRKTYAYLVSLQEKMSSSALSSKLKNKDEVHMYAAGNEYTEGRFYETIAEPSVRVSRYINLPLALYW